MERVTILFLSIFFAGTLSAQLYVQEKQPQPCGIDHRLDNRYQNPIEKITRRGFCSEETEIINESIGVFQMTQSENGIQFTRI